MMSILIFSILTTGVALLTLVYSLKDAEVVNIAGSMRMQSYRLAYDISSDSAELAQHVQALNQSMSSATMQSLKAAIVPSNIKQQYHEIQQRWQYMQVWILSDNPQQYLSQVAGFVDQLDKFVFDLQLFSESKLKLLALVGGSFFCLILMITLYIIRFVRANVVKPLGQLVEASEQIANKNFKIQLDSNNHTELGILSKAYQSMASELVLLYQDLNRAVADKTYELQAANNSLALLYHSSQILAGSRLSTQQLQQVLDQLLSLPGITAAKLVIEEKGGGRIELICGEVKADYWHTKLLENDDFILGKLKWQSSKSEPDDVLIASYVRIVAQSLYFNQARKHAEQLILMEERAAIARELHDSLAQSLSYLKIQMTLLKRQLNNDICAQRCSAGLDKINDIEQVLAAAYTQLRELLNNFRLTIKEADFGEALSEMIKPLQQQTKSQIEVQNLLTSIELDASQQVHLLQFIREATLNAIKHAKAQHIVIRCQHQAETIEVFIQDDGVGFDSQQEKSHHYGLSIMQERATRLHAEYQLQSQPHQGCCVTLTMNIESKEIENDSL